VEGMRLGIENIIRAPQTLDRLSAAARQKVRDTLTWEAKANQIAAVYDAVLSGATKLTFSA
jgi:glycosyltransferase involved in cell wall biosynthesis